jgi:hypothetical protein
LIFNKYGNRCFLAKLFDEDNANGGQVIESRYEKTVNKATLEARNTCRHPVGNIRGASGWQNSGGL